MDLESMKKVWEAYLEVTEKKLSPKQKELDVDKDGDIEGDDLAALRAKKAKKADESSCGKDRMKKENDNGDDDREECPKCKGKGCDHCDNKGYHMKEEVEGIDEDYMKSNQHPMDRSDAHHTQATYHTQQAAQAKKAGDNVAHGQHRNAARHHTAAGDAWARHATKVKKGMNVSPPHQMSKVAHSSTQNAHGQNEQAAADPIKGAPMRKGDKKNGDKSMAKDYPELTREFAEVLERAVASPDKNHTKGATKPEGLLDKESPKSKEFVDQHKVDTAYTDFEEKGHDDVHKAGRAVKSQSSARRGDNLGNGDSKSPAKVKDNS